MSGGEGVVQRAGPDIRPLPLSRLEWGDGQRRRSAEALAAHVLGDCHSVLAWYGRAKRSKQWMAIVLRWVALVSVAAGGVAPMLLELLPESLDIRAGWASIVFGLAAAALAVDRYLGFSSGWMRYVTVMMKVNALVQRYEILVERERVKWGAGEPTGEQVGVLLDASQNCLTELHQLVQDETNLWMTEFRETGNQLSELARTRAAEHLPGAATVRVSNGASTDGPWTLSVDGGPDRACTGTTTSVTTLAPGIHRFSARGILGGRVVTAEASVNVWAGQVAQVDLALE